MRSLHFVLATFLLVGVCSESPSRAANPVGWRSDGTGRFPDARPVTEWSAEKNVLWKTKLPARSHSAPVVVGNRVFVTSEPNELICLDAENGKILWTRSFTMVDVFGTEKAAQIEADRKAAKVLEKQRRQLRRSLRDLKNKQGTPPAQIERVEAELRKMGDKLKELTKYSGSVRGANGNTTATPASDGKSVFATFGNGVVTSYTIEGKRNWIRFVEAAKLGFGHSASPALADNKVIVHFLDLVALDANTGREVWRNEAQARHGSPIVATIGKTQVVVTPGGTVVRAADGTQLAKKLFQLGHSSPVLHERELYAMSKGKTFAYALPDSAEPGRKWEPRWEEPGVRQRRFASPVYHDGLIYGVTEKGILEVIDSQTGKLVYRRRLSFGNRGRVYPSPTVAGDFVFLSADNGVTLVLKPGRTYQQLARNELEPFSGAPVFVGSRMYVRGRKHLYCIGN